MTPELWTRCPKAKRVPTAEHAEAWWCPCHVGQGAGWWDPEYSSRVRVPFDEAARKMQAEYQAAFPSDNLTLDFFMGLLMAALGEDT